MRIGEIKIINERKTFDGQTTRIADVLVGDETGCINFFAKEESLELIKIGAVFTFRNVHAAVVKEHMRIDVDKWAKIEPAAADVKLGEINTKNNMSEEEYEMIPEVNRSGRGRRGGRGNGRGRQ